MTGQREEQEGRAVLVLVDDVDVHSLRSLDFQEQAVAGTDAGAGERPSQWTLRLEPYDGSVRILEGTVRDDG